VKVRIRKEGGQFCLVHATTSDRIDGINSETYHKAARLARRLSYVIAPRGIEKHYFLPDTSEPLTRADCSSGLTFWLEGHCSAAIVKEAAQDRGTFSHLTPCIYTGMRSIFSGQF